MMPADIVSTNEIAERLGVKPMTVHVWRQRHPDFPEPEWILSATPVWRWVVVRKWAEKTGRLNR